MVICMTGENSIGRGKLGHMKHARLTCIVLVSACIILLFGKTGLQHALASNQYGILGRKAPELGLNTWIDSDGKPMDPIEVSDYRGKVIYLYFFQDW